MKKLTETKDIGEESKENKIVRVYVLWFYRRLTARRLANQTI